MSDSLRLFLVEDDDDIALLVRKSLQKVGHQVTRCRYAADALIVLGQSTFDLVLLDQLLPDMEGLELLHQLSREGIVVPVLMITGRDEAHLATRVLRAGALDYIVKDRALMFLSDLPKRVADSVRRHRLEQTNQLLVQALESARDGVIITDLQGTIIEVNRSLEEQSGYSRQELIGQSPRLLKSGIHAVDFYQRMWQTILARGSWQGRTDQPAEGRAAPPGVDDHFAHRRYPEPFDALRRDPARRDRPQAPRAAAHADAEDAVRSAPWRAASRTSSTTSWPASTATPRWACARWTAPPS